jgi:hypothetical protein
MNEESLARVGPQYKKKKMFIYDELHIFFLNQNKDQFLMTFK